MEPRQTRESGLMVAVAGLAVVVFAVLLVGLTKEGGGPDWVSIITAIAGALLVAIGISTFIRKPGSKPT